MSKIKKHGNKYKHLRVLYIADLHQEGSTSVLRLGAMREVVGQVDAINTLEAPLSLAYKVCYHLYLKGINVSLPENCRENEKVKNAVRNNSYDVIWVDKGTTIFPKTLQYIKKVLPNAVIINYSPDNMLKRHCQSKQYLSCLSLYDFHVTTKSFAIDELKKNGARNVLFVNKTFEPSFHYPREVDEYDLDRLGADIGFIGAWEKERMESVLFLSRNGLHVRVWGPKEWRQCKNDNPFLTIEDRGLFGDDYVKAFKCMKISLCFLRKINEDKQTARSVEIPACGGFMIAERTDEHQALFEEGIEAEFFDTNEELLEKCRYYLKNDDKRVEIAQKGYERCVFSDYSNEKMIGDVFDQIGL